MAFANREFEDCLGYQSLMNHYLSPASGYYYPNAIVDRYVLGMPQ
jgi:hypothetical protein